MPDNQITSNKLATEELQRQIDEIKKKLEEKPLIEEKFVDVQKDGQRMIEELEMGTLKNITTKTEYGLLSSAQKTDLTDGGASTAHKHDAYIAKDGTTADVSADIPFNTHKLTGVVDPAADQDAATKKYVDDNTGDDFEAGDQILEEALTERSTTSSYYYELKAIVIHKGGEIRITFDAAVTNWSGPGYIRVYRDGTPVGTEHSTETVAPSWESFSEDISGWSPGDELEVYLKGDGAENYTGIKNLRIKVSQHDKTDVITD